MPAGAALLSHCTLVLATVLNLDPGRSNQPHRLLQAPACGSLYGQSERQLLASAMHVWGVCTLRDATQSQHQTWFRAAKFGVEYREPEKRRDLRHVVRKERALERASHRGAGFATGIDIFSEVHLLD